MKIKDKNGKEIKDGDILINHYFDGSEECKVLAKFGLYECCVFVDETNHYFNYYGWHFFNVTYRDHPDTDSDGFMYDVYDIQKEFEILGGGLNGQ